jgi:glutamate-ammonia-ligase adenylyltransferase
MRETETLLETCGSQWKSIQSYIESEGFKSSDCESIERLIIASQYALHQLQGSPEQINTLLQIDQFSLEDTIIDIENTEKVDLDQARQQLRKYRHRKLLEIIYLDVVMQTSLQQILRHLSDLADQLIGCALLVANHQLSMKHGQPLNDQGEVINLNVIAMGKLGGRELNFSSDVDLICSYDSDGELSGYGQLSYQEFFSRQVRLMSQLLNDSTADGFVYRVDLRLRPWGDSGPSVLSHSALEHYYQLHGREWEQYAMVKARVISGSAHERKQLASILTPFVFRKYHDYRVFEGLAALKDKIDAQAKSRGMRVNIKVGPGGIREIEFFVQAFQILKGGRNHQLQSTEIFNSFHALQQYQIVDSTTIEKLRDAYKFLRLLENRIQMFDDQQTHDLPDNPLQQSRIVFAMQMENWDELVSQLDYHREQVSLCFTELFRKQPDKRTANIIDDSFSDDGGDTRQWDFILNSGIEAADEVNSQLNEFLKSKAWRYMSSRARQRFNALIPELIDTIKSSDDAATLFSRFIRLFASIAGRSVYFELLFQNPALLLKLASLFERSAWIAEEVSQYPMLLENLIHPGEQNRFDKDSLLQRLTMQLENVSGDVELELDTLRLFKREQTLVIATAELGQEINAIEVGQHLCELAEVVLEAVYRLANKALQAQYGIPQCVDQDVLREAQLAIIGYGKLGGNELHYQSDLDLIFLHDSCGEKQNTNGTKSIENSVFFARLAQKIISMTSVLTASGKLYEIDSRLRPEGNSGLLVSSTRAYLKYQLESAWTWEHQALVRARQVAGHGSIEKVFSDIREQVLRLKRDPKKLCQDISEMRDRIYQNTNPPEGERRDIKHSRGGMIDIEFLVQYWVLLRANSIGSGRLNSDNIRLLKALSQLNLITHSQTQLIDIYQDYHRLLHESVLQNESAEINSELVATQMAHVTSCWNESFGSEN